MKKVALSIGGFDPSSGAGISADIKTFNLLEVYGVGVVTAITVQNTCGVFKVKAVAPNLVKDQLLYLIEDFTIGSVKISMVYKKETASIICEILKNLSVPVVFDPIIMSKNKFYLVDKEEVHEIMKKISSISTIITPNLDEASFLSQSELRNKEDIKKAASKMVQFGPKYVLIKGGHLKEKEKLDMLFDGENFWEFRGKSIETEDVHGTGCFLSSAITANLTKGFDMVTSVKKAKEDITHAISYSIKLGKGYKLITHFI